MSDEKLIENNFRKSLNTYDKDAVVQKKMAEFLFKKLKSKKFDKILEVGSYTGFLTKLTVKNIEFEKYLAIDIVDSFDYIKNLNSKIIFQKIKIEDYITEEKFDLIAANAALQWAEDFEHTILKLKSMLNKGGTLAVSIFGKENLKEISSVFNIGLNYFSNEEIKNILPEAEIYSNIEKIKFNSPIDILRHLKNTGANSVQKNKLNYGQIKEKLLLLDKRFDNTITYNPLYIIYQRP